MESPSLSVGDIIDITTERLAYGGDAIARHGGLAVFVSFAAPGDRLRVRITERKKKFARAAIEQILEPSPMRRAAPCRYFGECGGCQLQHLNYEAQLESKTAFVRDAIERIARIDWPHEIKILHGGEFGSRGRAQIKIDRKSATVGFNRAGSNSVCDVESCLILVPELDDALRALRGAARNEAGNDQFPANLSQVDLAAGESGVSAAPALAGLPSGALHRTVNGAVYSFSASTFFQVNPGLLEELVNEAVGRESGDNAIDLYAGVGLFTIQLAQRFARVIGVEADRDTARFGAANIKANGLANVEFDNGIVETWMKSFAAANVRPVDLIVLDPPRTGAAGALNHIVAAKPTRIIYISCDPATLARDLCELTGFGYELEKVTAIDLFPQTYHVETIAALARR